MIRISKLTADAGPGDIAPAESFLYRLAKKGDRLVVTDIVRATRENQEELAIDGPAAEAPWHTDRLHVEKVGEKVWLVGDRSVTDLDRYAAVTAQELDLVEGLWGDRITFPGHVLFFTRDPGNFAKWFGLGHSSTFNPENLGYQIRELGVRKDGLLYRNEYAASRIVVNLRNHQAGGGSPRLTIRHELAHAVSARATMTSLGE